MKYLAGLIVGVLVTLPLRGCYTLHPAGYNNAGAFRLNVWTGAVQVCTLNEPCRPVTEGK